MFIELAKVGIYIVPGFTDMRKQINGLTGMLYDVTDIDLQEPNLFVFCGKTRKHLKILYWEINGFCLWQKKLGKDKFPWPKNNDDLKTIDLDRMRLLLKGIDFWQEHKSLGSKVFL